MPKATHKSSADEGRFYLSKIGSQESVKQYLQRTRTELTGVFLIREADRIAKLVSQARNEKNREAACHTK